MAEDKFAQVTVAPRAVGSSSVNWTKLVPDEPEVAVSWTVVARFVGSQMMPVETPAEERDMDSADILSSYFGKIACSWTILVISAPDEEEPPVVSGENDVVGPYCNGRGKNTLSIHLFR